MIEGELFTRWTVRLALLAYFVAVAAMFAAPHRPRRASRLLYTLGCALMLVHIALAFHFHHQWSHGQAAADTIARTKNLIGIHFAGGIWFNYAFAAVWLLDVVGWWRGGLATYHRRPRWMHLLLHGFLLFIIFNATVVFETGWTRWGGLIGCAVIGVLAVGPMRRRRTEA
jgi:hypothetical protein